ncbi:MAG: phenylalanine--tRNA ligase subunit beta [Candidatus Cloacimonetes bacterium]|nr:phenylalanine--tRNA ligase subunit beta [Candidatus Cloacimonadota bacterium]
MNVSYKWLKKYVDFDLSPEELQVKITFAGIEVEAIEKLGEELNQVKVAKIIDKKKHPGSDHLSICHVDDGDVVKQVICGAPNCAVGQKIAFTPVGSRLGEFKIKKVKLRGEESYGMICSEKELGISDKHEGIMVLPDDAPIGQNLGSYLNLDDTSFELEITPNRPDLLGVYGVARDISAILNLPLKTPEVIIKECDEKIENNLILQNDAPDLCPRYTARMIKGITIKESPAWLKQCLISIGLRPINNVVDITNFVMMEFGHPLHAFDYNKIDGKKIIVRRAEKDEKFPALDEETYQLNENDLVIADAEKPIALAGIIGGENSHITEETSDIVIEAANFLYSSIRKTAGKLKITTDSSYRFERNIADETADLVSRRACQLILELAGGTLLKGKLDSYPNPTGKRLVSLRPSRVKSLLTINISNEKIKEYLKLLGLSFKGEEKDNLTFEMPSFRKDLEREIDLIEEIMRLHGYNNVKTFLKPQNIMDKKIFSAHRMVKNILVSYGFSEVINWNFGDPADLDKFEISEDDERRNNARLKNPLGTSFSIMRSMLIPDLFKNTLFNINHGQKNIKIFEQAKVYTRKNEKLATEKLHLSALMTGFLNPVYWGDNQRQINFFDLKGVVEEILDNLGLKNYDFKKSGEPFYQPGLATDVIYKKQIVGSLGKVDPKVTIKYDLEQPIFVIDIKLDDIFHLHKMETPVFKVIPKFPFILRDLSFIISKQHNYDDIISTIKGVNPGNIKKVVLFDEFTDKNIKKEFRSLTFSLVFSSDTKTLTDDYINNILQNVIKKLDSKYSIEMR